MNKPQDSKPPEVEPKFSDRFLRNKHRKDTKAFLLVAWLMLALTLMLGNDTWQGFRSGQWVDIGTKMAVLLVPWWLAAALTLCILLFALWCFSEYLKLKRTAPEYQPGDEDAGDA